MTGFILQSNFTSEQEISPDHLQFSYLPLPPVDALDRGSVSRPVGQSQIIKEESEMIHVIVQLQKRTEKLWIHFQLSYLLLRLVEALFEVLDRGQILDLFNIHRYPKGVVEKELCSSLAQTLVHCQPESLLKKERGSLLSPDS